MTKLLMKASLLSSNELEINVLYYAYIRNGGNFVMGDSEVRKNKLLNKEELEQLIKDTLNRVFEEKFSLYFAKAAKLSFTEDLLYLRNAVDQVVAPLKANIDDMKKTLDENHLRDITELRIKQKQLDDKETELYAAREKLSDLQNQLATQENEMGKKKEKIKKLESQLDNLRQALEAKKTEAADLSTKLSASEGKANGLEHELTDSKAEAEKLTGELSASEEKANGLEHALTNSKAEAEKLAGELSVSKEKATGLEHELTDSKAEVEKLTGELSASEEKANGLEHELTDSKAEAETLAEKLSVSEEKANSLAQELAEVDALLQPYHAIYKAFVACPVFKELLSQRDINDESNSSMLKLAEALGESYTIVGDMYEQMKSAKKENQEPLTNEEGAVYSILNQYYREHNKIEKDIFTLPGDQSLEQAFSKTDFNKNEQEDLTDPVAAKNRKYATKVYVPRLNRDNGNMIRKAIVEASNI